MDKQQKKEARRLFTLALKEREAGGKAIRAKIRNSTDRARYDAWDEKRSYGTETRWILLAQGLVKGMPYKAIEAKTGEQNPAYIGGIQAAAKDVAGITLTDDVVVAWLDAHLDAESAQETAPEVVPSPAPKPVVEPPKKGFFARLFSAKEAV